MFGLVWGVGILVVATYWYTRWMRIRWALRESTQWRGARIVDERERACDEHVVADGIAPATYAEGILKVCEDCLESGLACVAGVGDANLGRRIAGIMQNTQVEKTGAIQKMIIALAASATFAAPVLTGILTSPHAFAQEKVSALSASDIASAPAPTAESVAAASPRASKLYLGPLRAWELRSEVWLSMPDPATQPRRP